MSEDALVARYLEEGGLIKVIDPCRPTETKQEPKRFALLGLPFSNPKKLPRERKATESGVPVTSLVKKRALIKSLPREVRPLPNIAVRERTSSSTVTIEYVDQLLRETNRHIEKYKILCKVLDIGMSSDLPPLLHNIRSMRDARAARQLARHFRLMAKELESP